METAEEAKKDQARVPKEAKDKERVEKEAKKEQARLQQEAREIERAEKEAKKEQARLRKEAKEIERAEKEARKEQAKLQKEAKEIERAEKEARKEQARIQKEAKEREKAEKEAKKEQVKAQKEAKEKEKAEKEAMKEQARLQKEALRQEKELKRQQEEAEKEQKRKEREAAERKKQTDIQKQASIMDKFLQSQKEKADILQAQKHVEQSSQSPFCLKKNEEQKSSQYCVTRAGLVTSMDQELDAKKEYCSVELLRNHVLAWKAAHSFEKLWRWGERRHPKAVLYKELRLQGTSADVCNGTSLSTTPKNEGSSPSVQACKRLYHHMDGTQDINLENIGLDWENAFAMKDTNSLEDIKTHTDKDADCMKKHRKLFQFDKSHRPAYYGTFSKKSEAIGPRNPFKRDSSLDYEIDSDEEWEEDDPGESLSDCDRDEDDEKLDVEEDDAADGFVVPDGYLSENEGVQVEEFNSEENLHQQNEALPCGIPLYGETETEQQGQAKLQHVLNTMTEHALRSNCPFIIRNFSNDCSNGESFSLGKAEKLCLEALKIQTLIPGAFVEFLEDPREEMNSPSAMESLRTIRKGVNHLPDSSLPELVQFLLTCSQGMKKTVDSLSKIFPGVPKIELENKVRDISEFVGNHWQVKKEVMERMGISPPLATASAGTKKASPPQLRPITKFFSKRCLPLEEAAVTMQTNEDQNSKKFNLDSMQSLEQGIKKPKLDSTESSKEHGSKALKLEG